jgi:hypothetical protein
MEGGVGGGQGHSVDPDVSAAWMRGARDAEGDLGLVGRHAEEGGGALVAQNGTRAAAEHGGHPAAVARQFSATDRVDASMDGMQPAFADPMPDRRTAEPAVKKLRVGEDPVLPPCELPRGTRRTWCV